MEAHIGGILFGESYIGYNVWRLIHGTIYGDSYRGYN